MAATSQGERHVSAIESVRGWSPLLALFVLAFLWATVKFVSASLRRRSMPPGPRGIPLIGNVLQMPQEQTFLRFTEWAKTYGPIYSLNLAGKPVVVLNSLKVAEDLLDRRSAIYSDRPRLIVAGELMSGGMGLAFMPYGQTWRKERRAVHEAFNSREAHAYQELQEREAARLVMRLMSDSDGWQEKFERSTASTIVSIIYGTAIAERSVETIVKEVDHLIRVASRAAGKETHLVEVFPCLLRLPSWLAKWKRDGQAMFRRYTTFFMEYLDEIKAHQDLTDDNAETSFAAHIVQNREKYGLSYAESAWLSGILIGAGIDTTAGMLSVFMLAIVLYPDEMKRAQAELDTVVSKDRLPTFEDLARLPYVNAFVKELLRWKTVSPLGVPRRCTQDNWYEGYLIPEGTMVIENIWAMTHDTDVFPDPDEFNPERFLNEDIGPSYLAHKHVAFGFGRRICPGMNLAFQSLFIDVACMLWALDIRPKNRADGEPILPSKDAFIDDGLVVRPVQFPCVIQPRFKTVKGMLRSKISDTKDL